jgi:hypothetical protein
MNTLFNEYKQKNIGELAKLTPQKIVEELNKYIIVSFWFGYQFLGCCLHSILQFLEEE